MSTERRNPAPGATGNGAQASGQLSDQSTSRQRSGKPFWTKRRRTLLNLVRRREGTDRFKSPAFGEWCPNSTVAAWQSEGIEIAREYITVPGWSGEPTRVARYFLTDEQRAKAVDRLARDLRAAGLAESHEEAVRFITAGRRGRAE